MAEYPKHILTGIRCPICKKKFISIRGNRDIIEVNCDCDIKEIKKALNL